MTSISRADAIRTGGTRYFTGKPCPRGHISERLVSTRACAECAREKKHSWNKANPQKVAAQQRAYFKVNPEKVRAWKSAEQKRNRATANARCRKWYAANTAQSKAATANWRRKNRDKANAKAARRRAAELRCTPSWANAQKIARAYEIAAEYRARGIDAHVDHIVPLQGGMVCGLHVHDNLQIISGTANRSKSNHMKGN